jgi:two-component system chemotaxis sensor kinase CheA
MVDGIDKAREEFFSEAQELVESLSRNLLALDAAEKSGMQDPGLINEAFRAVHTLKGLSGLFGAKRISNLSHRLEDVLDSVRLGRVPLTAELLDLLFQGVELFGLALTSEKERSDEPLTTIDDFLRRIDSLGSAEQVGQNPLAAYDLDPGMLAVLTEYEEHRLRTNVELGQRLFRVRVQFDLATIDKALEAIKGKAKPFGEVITYLPTGAATSADTIELDLLLASGATYQDLDEALGADNVQIEEIPRRVHESINPAALGQ